MRRTTSPTAVGIVAGVLGGALLIAFQVGSRRGPMALFLPYVALMLGLAIYFLRAGVVEFGRRFRAALIAFMVASLMVDTFIVTVMNPAAMHAPIWNKLWPMGVMLLIGMASSAVVARLSEPPRWARSAPGGAPG